MGLVGSWSFGVRDYVSPFLRNESPTGTGVDIDVLISVDVMDDYSGINPNALDAYVNGIQAFNGPSTFLSPYNGPSSSITTTVVDGYDGYRLVFDSTTDFSPSTNYTIAIDAYDNYGNYSALSYNFTTGVVPTFTEGPFEINVDLSFSGEMLQNAALSNPANYVFSDGMYARLVDILDGYNLRLWVELFGNETSFTLNIDSSVTDVFGNPVVGGALTISPFFSTATLGNYNLSVRSWRDSALVQEDSQRVYLAGTRGIDIFRKQSASSFTRWAQILDSYGIDAMFVANFPSDLTIEDEDAPFLQNLSPGNGDTASANTTLALSIVDNTAVEITSVTIYVDGLTVFAGGYGGWSSGYSGTIIVGYKQLDFLLTPGSDLLVGSHTVRVVAIDLLGNILRDSYTFEVGSGSAFGSGPFGLGPFGGV